MATILVIDADPDFSSILQRSLKAYGHTVLTTRDGAEGLRIAETRQPATVLLDLETPGAKRLELVPRLRARAPALPVLILGRDISVDEENRARELGVAQVLRKGLKLDLIMEAINHTLRVAGRPVPQVDAPKDTRDSTILLVDDEPEIRELVGEFLSRRGYRIKMAADGEAGLAEVRNAPPDLILLDVYMPGMNGVEMLRQVSKSYSSVGVIMLTASQDEPLLKTALDLGAFDVLSKPVDLKQLELAVLVKLVLSAPD